MADDLRQRVEAIVAEFDGNVDFRRLVTLADDLGQASDRLAVTFHTIDAAFASHGSGTEAAAGEEPERAAEELTEALAPSTSRRRRSQKGSSAEVASDGDEEADQDLVIVASTAARSKG